MNREEIPLSATVTFSPEKSCLCSREYGDVHLTPNERRLLELIISGKCKKEAIFEEIWHSQGTIVSESSYHQLIKMLRRKLQSAGLPRSIIKTIPRCGIMLMPYEPLSAVRDEDAAVIEVASSDICIKKEPADDPQVQKFTSSVPLSPCACWLLAGLCTALVIFPPFLVPLLIEKPQAFPEQILLDGVAFHYSSKRSVDLAGLVQQRRALPAKINNVYIASNGPKVVVAQCEGELSKEGKCSYEYSSSY